MEKLFVYGSLQLGQPNESVLRNIGGQWKKGYVLGKLYEEGWGAALGCPGIRVDEPTEKVQGYVFYSKNLVENWKKLDDFEGEDYQRVPIKVFLEDGTEEINVFIYTLK